jgi:hypothetical protein
MYIYTLLISFGQAACPKICVLAFLPPAFGEHMFGRLIWPVNIPSEARGQAINQTLRELVPRGDKAGV